MPKQTDRPITDATIQRLKDIFEACLSEASARIGEEGASESDIVFAVRDDVMALLREDISD